MKLKLVIFDLDGTVVENNYDWAAIRKELGLESGSILNYLHNLPEPLRSEKYARLEAHERRQTEQAKLKEGIKEFLNWLDEREIKTALVTNNNRENTYFLLERFNLRFDLVLTRESGLHKPSSAPFLKVMEIMEVKPQQTAVVGDTNYDLMAGREAGISRIFILKGSMTPADLEGALIVQSFAEIKKLLEETIEKT
ncbi:MAG: HAD family hydrolase [Candidatus Saccharicenans sp.]|nr:MAG: hypothetical protein C0168_10845 [Candidatus Aminicenantes bacterium]HEK86743.1 HAD family hydrolase [Candidatus Aminicenantes bacterium]